MPIEFRCPKGHKLQVADRMAGRTVRCPKCSAQAVVPPIQSDDNFVSDSEVELVKPVSPAIAPVAASSSRARSERPPATPNRRGDGQGLQRAAVDPDRRSPTVAVVLLAGLGGMALVGLLAVGAFVGWRLVSAPGAMQQEAAISDARAPQSFPRATKVASPVAKAASERIAKAEGDDHGDPSATASDAEKESTRPAEVESTKALPSKRTQQIVDLPGPMNQLVLGGSGRYLVAAISSVQKVALIDVAAKRVAKLIPIDDADSLIAAGETSFVVLERGQGIISRYKLETGEREATKSCEPYADLAMGSSSEGPLLAFGSKTALIDLKTLEANDMRLSPSMWDRNSHTLTAAANGRVFAGSNNNVSPRGLTVFEVDGDTIRSSYQHNSYPLVLPSPDGQVIYAGMYRFDSRCRPIGDHSPTNGREATAAFPAATGPFYMRLLPRNLVTGSPTDPLRLTIHYQNNDNAFLTVKGIVLPDLTWDTRVRQHPPLPQERRLFWMPVADAIVSVPDGYNQLVIQHFNLKEELDNGGNDYFQLASVPPRLFKRGQKFSYAIEVLSKQGGVQYTLESGPPGAAVSPDGVLTWDVPSDFSPHDAPLVVKVQNSGGQELSHSFKLVDGEETPQVADVDNRRLRTTSRADAFAGRARTVTAPALSPPKSVNENRWDWIGGSPIPVRGEKGNFGGLILGDKLYLLKDNGALSTKAVTLPSNYMAAGLRSAAIVGLAANPTRVEIVSRTGKLIRKVDLDNVAPLALALHPHQPICYACLDLSEGQFRGKFVSIDEHAGTIKTGEENLGQDAIVDPTGRFLVTSYVHQVNLGDQIVVTETPRGFAGSRRGRSASRFGRSLPATPAPAPRVGLMHRYLNVPLMLVFDLDSPLQPEMHAIAPQKGGAGALRISCDGHRLAMLQTDATGAKYAACDPLDLKAPTTLYDCVLPGGRHSRGADLAFHPSLPLSTVVSGGTIAYFDAESGTTLPAKQKPDAEQLGTKSVRRALFSLDGKHLVVLAGSGVSDQSLFRVALPITPDQQAALRKKTAAHAKLAKANGTPLADVTAWRGGLPKTLTTAQISANYGDAVVIVKTANSTGSGFVVGSSGLVLTCAHCASPLDATQVVYHPAGKTDQKITAEATILYRDRKTDLALLKFNTNSTLHAVVLADPVDVKSGEDVTIIANPGLGKDVLDNTVTSGIISNVDRTIADNHYIQSSAAVNPGSSGGPMFDRNGEVIGVVVLKAGIDGVGFAIPPLSIAKFLLRATRRDGQKGRLERSWVDAAMKTEIPGILFDVKDKSITLADKSGGEPKVHPFADFSTGDRKLLDLIEADE